MTAARTGDVVVVMGVSGCGKTTVGRALAADLGVSFYDADAFHTPENVAKMRSGEPLDDDDRRPWLARLANEAANWSASGGAVLACSALKRRYRQALRACVPVRFVYLDGTFDEIAARVAEREVEFFPPALLHSQFEALEPPGPDEALRVSIAAPPAAIATHAASALRDAMPIAIDGGPEVGLSDARLDELIDEVAQRWVLDAGVKRLLLLPPDHTRLHSFAGPITTRLYQRLAGRVHIDVMPTLGTHKPMTAAQLRLMFGDAIPRERIIDHDWREGLETLGSLPAEFLAEHSSGRMEWPVPVAVSKHVVSGGYDLVLSIGQVVPHEVIGFANHTKNVCIGAGGGDLLQTSHFLGAVVGIEEVLGTADNPVRRLVDEAFYWFVRPRVDLRFLLTVVDGRGAAPRLRAFCAGTDSDSFRWAADLACRTNVERVERPLERCVVTLDPREFHSTWLGNKAVYRTRKAMADGGELVVLAPAIDTFGEDPTIDALVRKHGYRGTDATLAALETDPGLKANLSAAAHLIHGSSEGRFRVTYCPGPGLVREEVEGVGYNYRPYAEAAAEYAVEGRADGWHTTNAGEPFYYLRNPALGLWST
ncbi:MAG: gluconokinase, GntK/IdnK-type [Lacipirellulaceae bacterium]